jgi:hypothetical protein
MRVCRSPSVPRLWLGHSGFHFARSLRAVRFFLRLGRAGDADAVLARVLALDDEWRSPRIRVRVFLLCRERRSRALASAPSCSPSTPCSPRRSQKQNDNQSIYFIALRM